MKTKKIIVSGLIAGIVAFIVGSLLYMNPLVSGVYAQYSNYPCSKPMDVFGGLINWLFLMLIGGVVSAVFMAFLYAFTEKGIDIKPAWKKGLLFGFLLFLVNKLPTSCSDNNKKFQTNYY